MAELRRQFYESLKEWKQTKKNKCLLIKGARQIGKTFIVEKFGRECYEDFVEINFIEHPEYVAVFEKGLDADTGLSASVREDWFKLYLSDVGAMKRPNVPYGYKFTAGNVGVSDKKISIPHYMAVFLQPADMD